MVYRWSLLYVIFSSHVLFVHLNYTKKSKELSDYDWSVKCKFQPNGNDCVGHGKLRPRFYYDTKMQDCKTFHYGMCKVAFNNFNSLTQCHETCQDPGPRIVKENLTDKAFCRLQPEFGNCNEYHPMYYFDLNHRLCRGFSFSGCGGNNNRFPNPQLCTAVCGKVLEVL